MSDLVVSLLIISVRICPIFKSEGRAVVFFFFFVAFLETLDL